MCTSEMDGEEAENIGAEWAFWMKFINYKAQKNLYIAKAVMVLIKFENEKDRYKRAYFPNVHMDAKEKLLKSRMANLWPSRCTTIAISPPSMAESQGWDEL